MVAPTFGTTVASKRTRCHVLIMWQPEEQRVFSASLRNPGTKASSNSGFKDDER
jgi:hypothetical protein